MSCEERDSVLVKKNRRRKWIVIVLAAVFIGLAIVMGVLHFGNGSEDLDLPSMMKSTNRIHRFDDSEYKIIGGKTADKVMDMLKLEIGYTEDDSFQNITEESIGNSIYYQMQQCYKGYPVWNTMVNLETDTQGNVLCVTENRKEVFGEIKEPRVSEETAKNIIWKKYEKDLIDIQGQGLYVFNADNKKSRLVYSFFVFGCSNDGMVISQEILVDANKNKILKEINQVKFAEEIVSMQGSKQSFQVPVEKNVNKISLRSQGLKGYRSKNNRMSKTWDIRNEELGIDEIATEVENQKQENISKDSIDAYGNAYQTLQYYREHCPVVKTQDYAVVTGAKKIKYTDANEKEINEDYTNQACSAPWGDKQLLFFGPYKKSKNTVANSLDIVAHEMGHSVVKGKNKLGEDTTQSKTLNEAYADVFSLCTGNSKTKNGDWILETDEKVVRNISEPSKSNCATSVKDYIKGENMHHENSTIISHAAYLMWKNGSKLKDYGVIIDLWYRSLDFIVNEPTFADCEKAVYEAGKRMYEEKKLDEKDLRCIEDSFSKVGIDAKLEKIDINDKGDDEAESAVHDSDLKYTWVVEPTIEADNIEYVREGNEITYSTNELQQQFQTPYAVIRRGNALGLIDMEGNLKVETDYKAIYNYLGSYLLESMTPRYSEEKGYEWSWFYLDESGNVRETLGTSENYFIRAYYWCDGLHCIEADEDEYEYIDNSQLTENVIPVKRASEIYDAQQGIYPTEWVSKLESPYAICKKGKLITDFIYEKCGSESNGMLAVCKDGKWGYIDDNGETVIPLEYDASWNECGVWGIEYNYNGEWINYDYCYAASGGYINLCKGDKWELRNTKGEIVIEPGIFEAIRPVFDGKCWVKKDGKWGVIQIEDKKEEIQSKEEVTPQMYREIYEPILKDVYSKSGEAASYNIYSVYDIDKDGVKELIAQQGTCEADYMYQVYTIEDAKAKFLGEIPSGHSSFYMDENGGTEQYIIHSVGHMGSWIMTYVKIENGQIVKEEVASAQDENYYSNPYPLETAYLNDISLLK